MKVTIEIEGKPEEFQEIFIPSEKQAEFMTMTYDAYVDALRRLVWEQIDPHNFMGIADAKSKK
jgi:hypothetical protein